ncbi:MAG: helix-turn-helix domain-containing protein, partial [Planctomycetota bacterium]
LGPTPVQRPAAGDREPDRAAAAADLKSQRDAIERQAIVQAMREYDGDKVAAAHKLGLSRSAFYRRWRALGL